jgi:hypothetical protein
MWTRWKLGRLLALEERGTGPGRGKEGGGRPSFSSYIDDLGLKSTSAKEAQRIGALPQPADPLFP